MMLLDMHAVRLIATFAVVAVAAMLRPHDLAAQTATTQPLPPPAAATKQAPPKSSTKPAAKPAAGQPSSGQDEAALRKRVEQLEEQLVDLQVVIGTLESLAKTPPRAGAAAPSAADAQRIQALEAQLKSLGTQIEQLGEKVRGAGEPMKRSEATPPAADPRATASTSAAPAAYGPQGAADVGEFETQTESQGSATVTSSRPDAPPAAPAYETAPGSALPPIGSDNGAPQPAAGADVAALPPGDGGGDPKHDYEVAYSYVIQRDYAAAQAGFTDFMKRHPKDALVPNALYWLGETHYQQRNFADAAEAFDLVTKMYASSPKAADSQLKRALSYSALGKNNEACAALNDLDARFQSAPVYVKTRAGSERRRLGCTG